MKNMNKEKELMEKIIKMIEDGVTGPELDRLLEQLKHFEHLEEEKEKEARKENEL